MDFCGLFIKFGDENHLQQLLQEGLLYCNPIQYFLDIEDNKLRGDKLESAVEMKFMQNVIIQIKPVNNPVADFSNFKAKNLSLVSYIDEPFGNLFCLHAINFLGKEEDEIVSIDKQNKTFGSHILVIKDTSEFLERVKKEFTKENLSITTDLVQYFDFSKYNGKKTIFQKDIAYKYQKEFRIFIRNNTNKAITVKLGSLSNIAEIYPSSVIDTIAFKARNATSV